MRTVRAVQGPALSLVTVRIHDSKLALRWGLHIKIIERVRASLEVCYLRRVTVTPRQRSYMTMSSYRVIYQTGLARACSRIRFEVHDVYIAQYALHFSRDLLDPNMWKQSAWLQQTYHQ